MSQQYPPPFPFPDPNNTYLTPPPTTNFDPYSVSLLAQAQAQVSDPPPATTSSFYTGAFSPTQLSALLDERLRELDNSPVTEADMNLGGIDFPSLQRYVFSLLLRRSFADSAGRTE